MPNTDSTTTLRAVFTFYSDILTLNSEGDSVLSEETLKSLGTNLLYTFLGSIFRIASPPPGLPPELPLDRDESSSPSLSPPSSSSPQGNREREFVSTTAHILPVLDDTVDMNTTSTTKTATQSYVQAASIATTASATALSGVKQAELPAAQSIEIKSGLSEKSKRSVLISYIPDSGYFIAGAVAGGISRTATAPLDRLKVYLLVNTTSGTNAALDAAKKGQPIRALKHAGVPLFTAVSDLYKSGGFRGFFAGN